MQFVSSVGLLLFAPDKKMLIIKELTDKVQYEKVAGMLSVPIETVEPGENTLQALRRLVVEEVGFNSDSHEMTTLDDIKLSFQTTLRIVLNSSYTEIMTVYVGRCQNSFVASPGDDDIEYYGWMTADELLTLPKGQLRVEMHSIIRECLRL